MEIIKSSRFETGSFLLCDVLFNIPGLFLQAKPFNFRSITSLCSAYRRYFLECYVADGRCLRFDFRKRPGFIRRCCN